MYTPGRVLFWTKEPPRFNKQGSSYVYNIKFTEDENVEEKLPYLKNNCQANCERRQLADIQTPHPYEPLFLTVITHSGIN